MAGALPKGRTEGREFRSRCIGRIEGGKTVRRFTGMPAPASRGRHPIFSTASAAEATIRRVASGPRPLVAHRRQRRIPARRECGHDPSRRAGTHKAGPIGRRWRGRPWPFGLGAWPACPAVARCTQNMPTIVAFSRFSFWARRDFLSMSAAGRRKRGRDSFLRSTLRAVPGKESRPLFRPDKLT